MPAPEFIRPIVGNAVSSEADVAALNAALRQIWLAIASGASDEQIAEILDAAGTAIQAALDAGAARDASFAGANVFADIATGRAAVSNGEQFMVVEGNEIVRYRRDSASTETEMARYPTAARVEPLAESILPDGDIPGLSFAVIDRSSGAVAFGLASDDGRAVVSGIEVFGAVKTVKGAHPDYSVVWCDEDGRIATGLRRDGSGMDGSGGGGAPVAYSVEFMFFEPITSEANLYVTWVANSPGAKGLEYRVAGARSWDSTASVRTRGFPALPGYWLHTAELTGLAPDTIYEMAVIGADFRDTVKTSPMSGIKIMMASDWQTQDYSPSGRLQLFGPVVTATTPDLGIFNGDINNSDGRFTTAWAQDYVNIFKSLSANYRTRGGAQFPWIYTMGNHEGRNAAGTSNAHTGGDGTPGMIADICSWGYFDRHPTRFTRSAATLRIGDELFITALETDHTVPLMSQFDWWRAQMAAHAPQVRHSFVVGHVAPFNVYNGRYTDQACRDMRNHFWPEAEQYAGPGGSLRAWLSAHAHNMVVTPRLKMDVRPGETLATRDNDFFRDAEGLRNLGFGQLGPPAVAHQGTLDRTSNIDGQPFYDAVLARTAASENDYEISGSGVTNPSAPVAHVWLLTLGDASWGARAINLAGTNYYEITESI